MRLRPAVEFNNSYSTFVFTKRAVKVIEAAAATPEHPMFLYLPYQNVCVHLQCLQHPLQYPFCGDLSVLLNTAPSLCCMTQWWWSRTDTGL